MSESLHIGSTNLYILPLGSPAPSITAVLWIGMEPAADEYCISYSHFISLIKMGMRTLHTESHLASEHQHNHEAVKSWRGLDGWFWAALPPDLLPLLES